MTRCVLQAGHSPLFAPFQPGGGGAPGEANWTGELATRIRDRLVAAGVDVAIVGAWLVYRPGGPVLLAPPDVVRQDADLFASLHYDAAIYSQNTGCFADRATGDPMADQSDRFIRIWESIYPAATGIALHNERRNPNTRDYYGFRATTDHTPGILIEHGVGAKGAGDDAAVLWDQIDRVADLDAAAILAYLGVANPTGQETDMDDAERQALQAQIDSLNGVATELGNQVAALHEEISHLRDVVVARAVAIGNELSATKRLSAKRYRALADELSHLAD